jgi:hypothetical protein
VHENKRELNYGREYRVLTSPLFAQQCVIKFNVEIYFMHIINKQETILLKNKYNLSSVGTDCPPNH